MKSIIMFINTIQSRFINNIVLNGNVKKKCNLTNMNVVYNQINDNVLASSDA